MIKIQVSAKTVSAPTETSLSEDIANLIEAAEIHEKRIAHMTERLCEIVNELRGHIVGGVEAVEGQHPPSFGTIGRFQDASRSVNAALDRLNFQICRFVERH